MRHDLGRHADGNAVRPLQQQERDLGRQGHRLDHPAVIGFDKFGKSLLNSTSRAKERAGTRYIVPPKLDHR